MPTRSCCAAALGQDAEFTLSAINGHSAMLRSRHSDGRSTPVATVPYAGTSASWSTRAAIQRLPLGRTHLDALPPLGHFDRKTGGGELEPQLLEIRHLS